MNVTKKVGFRLGPYDILWYKHKLTQLNDISTFVLILEKKIHVFSHNHWYSFIHK